MFSFIKDKAVKRTAVLLILALTVFNSVVIATFAMNPPEASNAATTTEVLTTRQMPEETTKKVILKDSPLLFTDFEYTVNYDVKVCNDSLEEIKLNITHLEDAIKSNTYTPEACASMNQEIIRLSTIASKINSDISKITSWESEYYYAIKAWKFFIQRGYSEEVTSAIIGNMMVETSGGTLALKPKIYDATGDYYGLCQWSLYYRPEVNGLSFEAQLEYLESDMAKEFKTFGKCYRKGFTYENFLAMKNPAEAAKAFAKVYERCATWSYAPREKAAMVAYAYFSLDS